MKHMLKCASCSKYTLKPVCECGSKALIPKPAKFSPEDPYGKYRRQAKHKMMEEKGLL